VQPSVGGKSTCRSDATTEAGFWIRFTNQSGSGVPAVSVSLTSSASPGYAPDALRPAGESNASGVFAVPSGEDLSTGFYVATHADYLPRVIQREGLDSGDTFCLVPAVKARIQVVTEAGVPIENASVLLYGESADAETVVHRKRGGYSIATLQNVQCVEGETDASGWCAVGVLGGRYSVSVHKLGWFCLGATPTIEVSSKEMALSPIVMAQLRAIAISVAPSSVLSSSSRMLDGWRMSPNYAAAHAIEALRASLDAASPATYNCVLACEPSRPGLDAEPEATFRFLVDGVGWVEQKEMLPVAAAMRTVALASAATQALGQVRIVAPEVAGESMAEFFVLRPRDWRPGQPTLTVPFDKDLRLPIGAYGVSSRVCGGSIADFDVVADAPRVVALRSDDVGGLVRLSLKIAGNRCPWGVHLTATREGDGVSQEVSLSPQVPLDFPLVLVPGVWTFEVVWRTRKFVRTGVSVVPGVQRLLLSWD
jgi:hypothetical protein